jgi:sugar phosphate isomerase/epimerase
MIIGAQLYTVRDFAKNLDDFSETLKKIADIGYRTVQVSGTCDFEADWLRERLRENGLSCVLTHTKPADILENTDTVCRNHGIFDCRNIGLGAMPGGGKVNDEVYEKFVADFTPAMQKIAPNGYRFFYHNHAFEFTRSRDGKLFIDKLLEDFPADLLGITFDTYWVQFAGADVCDWMDKLKGRLECIHLKDMVATFNNKNRMAPVGWGNMNFEKIIAAAERADGKYLLVEQDECYEEDPFDCLKKSYDYLTSLGLSS